MSIDVHCHFFNKEILSLRLLVDMLWVMIRRRESTEETRQAHIGRAIRFLRIGLSNVPQIYKTLESDERDFAFCPLMFDLEACTWTHGRQDDTWQTELRETLDDCAQKAKTPEEKEAMELISLYINKAEFHWDPAESQTRFHTQVKQLEELALAYPGRVMPFFAVDPRRAEYFGSEEGLAGVLAKLKRNGGLFYGIKMYTPNGYSPTDPRLWPLYDYCERFGIPITAHCSGGGFATFAKSIEVNGDIYKDGRTHKTSGILSFEHNGLFNSQRVEERGERLNHPKLWALVLERYPRLKLNLAHFGLHDGSGEWTDLIYEMMQTYENLYSDFSCVCEAPALDHFYKAYYTKASTSVKARFLYGSDFYLNILFTASIKTYVDQFKTRFEAGEWTAITGSNPRQFLGLDHIEHSEI